MPNSSREFRNTLGEIKAYIELIGDDIENIIEQEQDDGVLLEGYRCRHGDHTYMVHGTEEQQHFTVQYPYSLSGTLASLLDVDTAHDVLPDDTEVEPIQLPPGVEQVPTDIMEQLTEQQMKELAAEYILDDQDEELMRQLEYELVQLISSENCSYSNRRTEQGTWAGFDIQRKIYPSEEGFTTDDFNRAVQTVVSKGHRGVIFIRASLDIEALAGPGQEYGPGELPAFY